MARGSAKSAGGPPLRPSFNRTTIVLSQKIHRTVIVLSHHPLMEAPMEIANHPMHDAALSGTFPADPPDNVRVSIRDLNFYYGATHALKNVTIDYIDRQTTAM